MKPPCPYSVTDESGEVYDCRLPSHDGTHILIERDRVKAAS